VYPPADIDGLFPSHYPALVAQAPLTVRRWTRSEYDRLVGLGVLEREPIELIGGQLIVAEPQSAYHAGSLRRADYTLRAALPAGWVVSIQSPVSLDDDSEPEPDLVVAAGRPDDYLDAHPAEPVLVVEVAESSLAFDRRDKGGLYARAGIPEYWIINLVDRVLEVYRAPEREPSAPYGWAYRSTMTLVAPAIVAPVAISGVQVPVAGLLP
jgi:Uma2 family endonuclease